MPCHSITSKIGQRDTSRFISKNNQQLTGPPCAQWAIIRYYNAVSGPRPWSCLQTSQSHRNCLQPRCLTSPLHQIGRRRQAQPLICSPREDAAGWTQGLRSPCSGRSLLSHWTKCVGKPGASHPASNTASLLQRNRPELPHGCGHR